MDVTLLYSLILSISCRIESVVKIHNIYFLSIALLKAWCGDYSS